MPAIDLQALLGLPLDAALEQLAAAGLSAPNVSRSLPARTRHTLPSEVDWRVARALWDGDTPTLVAVPSVPLPAGLPINSEGA